MQRLWSFAHNVFPRRKSNLLVLLFLLPVLAWQSNGAWAQGLHGPVDPLRRPEAMPGRFSFDLVLGYAPGGGSLLGVDEARGPYRESYATHSLAPRLTVSYALDRRLSLSLGLGYTYTLTQAERRYADGRVEHMGKGEGRLLPQAGLSYRLDQESPLDPLLDLSLAYPWAVRASVSASWIRDPVVLSGAMEYAQDISPFRPAALALYLGAGFVANDRVSYTLTVALSQPLAFAIPATLWADFTVSYALDTEGREALSLTVSASERGVAAAGLTLGYRVL